MTEKHARKAPGTEPAAIEFPESGYIGVAAEFAELFSRSYEAIEGQIPEPALLQFGGFNKLVILESCEVRFADA